MISEAIILAGGFGTRLKGAIKDIPKSMAPINNKPFLEYILRYLVQQNINHIILSVGYKHEIISNYFGDSFKSASIKYAIEDEPLGTGGGIFNAMNYLKNDEAIIINGDTYFDVNLFDFYHFHITYCSELTLALKKMKNFERYGSISLNNYRITSFQEKNFVEDGYINGGIYVCDKNTLYEKIKKEKFSFEKDFMEKYIDDLNIMGFTSNNYFIDIGIPEDYERAQIELPKYYSV
ncbi:nucleotidyltransferase family protein [Bacteroidota bacterium]